jgi:Tat protein translocase TatB subunit
MFGIGMTELMVVFVGGLVVLGPNRLPSLARSLGRTLAEFRHASNDLRRDFMDVANHIDLKDNEHANPVAEPEENTATQDPATDASVEPTTAEAPRQDKGSGPASE